MSRRASGAASLRLGISVISSINGTSKSSSRDRPPLSATIPQGCEQTVERDLKYVREFCTIEYSLEDYQALERTVTTAFKTARCVIVSLDSLDSIALEDVRRLVKLLRRSRDLGGELALRAGKPEVRRVLAITALDRVFTMIGPEAA